MVSTRTRLAAAEEWRAALELLKRGDYAMGWRLWERRPVDIGGRETGKPAMPMPEWDGRAIRSLLILPEQGLGDQIMFARYVPLLRELGIQPYLMCHPLLVRLFANLDVPIIPAQGRIALPPVDAWILGPSLPAVLRTEPATVPGAVVFPGGDVCGAGVGLMATGNPAHLNDRNRSLPPQVADRLLSLPGLRDLNPHMTGAVDLEATRQIMSHLALVISVDTATAHLAGSMGKPCWVLLPHVAMDWRWADGVTSPWYPASRLFRQPAAGDWNSVVSDVRAALNASDLSG